MSRRRTRDRYLRVHGPVAPVPRRRTTSRTVAVLAAIAVAVTMFVAGASYSRALGAPGYATTADKTSAWMHGHHLGIVVTAFESWLYGHHPPSRHAADPHQFATTAGALGTIPASLVLPRLPIPEGAATAPAWTPGPRAADGQPYSYTARFEPDSYYPSIVVGVAVISTRATAHLGLGTAMAGDSAPAAVTEIPTDQRASLIADFNSGFRFADITGGLYHQHQVYRSLHDGQASAVIDDAGHLQIGTWGRDLQMTPHTATVRQNLALIVDNGRVASGVGDGTARWGGAHLERQYTWRSALGVDRAGNLIYLAGDMLNLPTLARAATQAGAVRAMQLDMHHGNSLYVEWTPDRAGHRTGRKLLAAMPGDTDRYLAADRRDFFYLTAPPPHALPPPRTGHTVRTP